MPLFWRLKNRQRVTASENAITKPYKITTMPISET